MLKIKANDIIHKSSQNIFVVFYDFEKGKIYCIIGKSGAGMTTLLSLLSGLATPYDPDIILADEPTGNLDRDTQKEIMDIFRDLANNGKCVILVSHSPDVAAMCDERYELLKIPGKAKRNK